MKGQKMHKVFIVVLLCTFSCSDTSKREPSLLPKVNKTINTILIVAQENEWTKPIKEGVDFIFQQPVKGLYSEEPEFDLVQISDLNASDLLRNQRFIIELIIDSKLDGNKLLHKKNRWAEGQLFFQLSAPDEESLLIAILNNGSEIKQLLEEHQEAFFFQGIDDGDQKVFKENSIGNIILPKSFVQVVQEQHFVYFGQQGKALCESGNSFQCPFQLGYFIYDEPYKDVSQFSKKHLRFLRDSLAQIYILGPEREVPTYMETEKKFPIVQDTVTVNGKFTIKQSGWWNMVNATMGGPFRTFAFVNEATNTFYFSTLFVFAPNFKKRDFLYELELYNQLFVNSQISKR